MLNGKLFEDKKDMEIARLKMEIERRDKIISDFKEYDAERKKYISNLLTKIGGYESFIEEIEDAEPLVTKVKAYKERVSYLELMVQTHKIEKKYTKEQMKEICGYAQLKKHNTELQKRVRHMQSTIDELIYKLKSNKED